jgi:hypothetical protein
MVVRVDNERQRHAVLDVPLTLADLGRHALLR